MRRLLFLTVIICSACMESNNPLKKATIYYNPNQTPWGILKVVDTPSRVFLKDSLKLNKLTITNFDSLKFIYDQIEHATRDSISFDYQEVDTSIAVMLHSDQKLDTLFLDGYSHLQYNDCVFRDSALTHYIIKMIRLNNKYWEDVASEYYYNGQYNGVSRYIYPFVDRNP